MHVRFARVLMVLIWPLLVALPGGVSAGSGGAVTSGSLAPRPSYPDQYSETVEDLRVKVLGGYVSVNRTWYRGQWDFNRAWNQIIPTVEYGCDAQLGGCPYVKTINRNGIIYSDTGGNHILKDKNGKRRLFRVLKDDVQYPNSLNVIGYRWEDLEGNWIQYEHVPITQTFGRGRAVAYGDNNNVRVNFTYDAEGQLAGVYDHNNSQVLWYTYDTEGRVISVRDYTNREVQYEYTGTGNLSQLTAFTDVRGKRWQYVYGTVGGGEVAQTNTLEKKIDPLGREITLSRTNTGMLASMLDQDQQGIKYGYSDDKTRNEFRTDRYFTGGRVEGYVFNRSGVVVRRDINDVTVETVADSDQEKIFTDRNGNKTVQKYDGQLNLISRTHPDGSSATFSYKSLSIPAGVDPSTEPPMLISRLVEETDENGVKTHYDYDQQGNRIRETQAVGTADERIIEYTYDGSGNLTALKFVADADTTEAVWGLTYDTFGNIETVTDPEANTSEYTYDVLGNVLSVKDGRQKSWTYTYDDAGNLLTAADPLGNTTSFDYDDVGNLITFTDPENQSWQLEYDARDNVTKITDPYNKTILYAYNGQEQVTEITDESGKRVNVAYDPAGRPVTETDGAGNVIRNEYADNGDPGSGSFFQPARVILPTYIRELLYDSRNRLIQDTDDLGSEGLMTRYGWDAIGRLIGETNPAGNSTSYSYDARGNLTGVTDALNQTVELTYDDRDNLVSVKDQKGQETHFEYDDADRLVREIRPLGQTTVYGYDADDNLTSIIDAKGQKLEFVYDDAGRLLTERHFASTSATTPTKTITYTYDDRDLLTGWDDGQSSATFTYDDLGRKLSETVDYGPFSLSHSYTYYANGLKKTYTAPDGITYEYLYDAANRVTGIKIPGQGTMTVNEFNWLVPAKTTVPGGMQEAAAYTGLLEPETTELKDPAGNSIFTQGFAYDLNRNITEKNADAATTDYTYDFVDRLLSSASTSNPDEEFAFDAASNRIAPTGSSEAWVYNENNELLSKGSIAYQNDENGNRTRKDDVGTVTSYEYDELNRLVDVKDGAGGVIASYGYDPFDRRLWKNTSGTTTYYAYSDDGLVGEYTNSGAQQVGYGYWPDSGWGTDPAFLKKASGYFYYQNDHLGTPQKLISSNGNVVWSARYESFGAASVDSGSSIVNNLRFAGQYFDGETGLHYNWRRFYDPDIGSYITTDPIGFAGGMNWYLYGSGNPVNAIDPTGECFVAGAAVGALTSAIFSAGSQYYSQGCINWSELGRDAAIGAALGLTCGIGSAALTGSNVIKSAQRTRVFWSGQGARRAAEAWAKANGGVTLEMTLPGKLLDRITNKYTYPVLRPLWNLASRNFARGADKAVRVFQNEVMLNIKAVWGTIEYPVLKKRGTEIIYNLVK